MINLMGLINQEREQQGASPHRVLFYRDLLQGASTHHTDRNRATTREQGATIRDQGATTREQGATTREQGPLPGATTREQGATTREHWPLPGNWVHYQGTGGYYQDRRRNAEQATSREQELLQTGQNENKQLLTNRIYCLQTPTDRNTVNNT